MARTSLEKRSSTADVSNRLLDTVATGFYPRASGEKEEEDEGEEEEEEEEEEGEKRNRASLLVLESRIRKIHP